MVWTCPLWLKFLFLVSNAVNVLGETKTVSGNAMDLANMNMHLMQTGCPLLPCQSACVKKNVQTGCYECACGPGRGTGVVNPSINNPMLPIGNGQLYGCNPSWVACSSHCPKVADRLGCFRCKCQTPGSPIKVHTVLPTTISLGSSTSINNTQLYSSPLPSISAKPQTSISPLQKYNKTIVTPPVMTSPPVVNKPSHLDINKQTSYRTTRVPLFSSNIPLTKLVAATMNTLTVTETKNEEQRSSPTYFDSSVNMHQRQSEVTNDGEKGGDLKFIIALFSIGTVLVISIISSFVFLILWRRSARQLRKNKDELYFVNKANRQDSHATLSRNDMLDPIYTDVHSTPVPPPRTPIVSSVTPTAPASDVLLRFASCSSETPLKQTVIENTPVCHDYLELI